MNKSKKNIEPVKSPETVKLTVSEVTEEVEINTLAEGKEDTPIKKEDSLPEESQPGEKEPEVLSPEETIDKIFSSGPGFAEEEKNKKEEIPAEKEKPKELEKEAFFPPKTNGKRKKPFLKIFFTFLIGFFLGGLAMAAGFYFLISPEQAQNAPKEPVPVPTEIVKETTSNSSEGEEKIDYSQYKVQVLNGSGVKGAAALVKELFSSFDFSAVDIGNASVSNQQETKISLKKSLPVAFKDEIVKLLAEYSLSEGENLPENGDYDVQIIVGVKKSEE